MADPESFREGERQLRGSAKTAGFRLDAADGGHFEGLYVPLAGHGYPGHAWLLWDVTGREERRRRREKRMRAELASHRLGVHAQKQRAREAELAGQELQERDAALSAVDALRKQLLATASHELRSPLASITSFCELLTDSVDPGGDGEEFVRIIERNATPTRAGEAADAARLLDARLVPHDLEDTHISEGNPTIGLIEQAVRAAAPDVVYTHSLHDAHQDHRAVHRASMVATRKIATVGCYQSPSATVDYRPNHFIDIAAHVEDKLRLIACYRSQTAVRDYLEEDTVRAVARYWSRYSDAAHAEPIEIIRQQAAVGAAPAARPAGAPAWTESVDA
jgi:LmbE family N-acetylglucosaminyl deacetylase